MTLPQAGLLPDPAAVEEPRRLLERLSEWQRQRPSLPSRPQSPEGLDKRVERFPSIRVFLTARDVYRQERRRWIAVYDTWRKRVTDLEAAADTECRRRCGEQTREEALYRRYASALPDGDSRLARRPWRVDGNWLVLHRRGLVERNELLFSSVSADNSLPQTLGLPIGCPERLFRLDARSLLFSSRGKDGGRLIRVGLCRDSGIVHHLGRGGVSLQRAEWPEGQL